MHVCTKLRRPSHSSHEPRRGTPSSRQPATACHPILRRQDLGAGHDEVYYGFSGKLAAASGEEWQQAFAMINALGK